MWVQSQEHEPLPEDSESPSRSSSSGRTDYSQDTWRINGLAETEAERPSETQSEMTLKRKRMRIEAYAGSNLASRDDADSNDDDEEDDEHYEVPEMHHRERPPESWRQHERRPERPQFYQKALQATKHVSGHSSSMVGRGPGSLLDLGDDIKFEIPEYYDELGQSLHLPSFTSLQIEEKVVYGRLKATAFFAIMDADPWARQWRKQAETGVKRSKFSDTDMKRRLLEERRFGLQVIEPSSIIKPPVDFTYEDVGVTSDVGSLDESPITFRHISTESGQSRRCEVKILEHGDGYELIQRKVQKIEPARRDPDEVVQEDEEKIAKYWVNLVRKDLPKHHKHFTAYYKKQILDVKRVAEFCQREVKNRNVRSLKFLKAAPMRTRRLARDMIIFWKKWDKEQIEIRKKEEKEAAEALKRDQELREAKRQQQRLNFLLTQTELYSHFMQNKSSGLPTQAAQDTTTSPDGESSGGMVGQNLSGSSAEDAAEEAALKEEALRAAELAVSQQKARTSAFDSESQMLRGAVGEVCDEGKEENPIEGGSDMDLLHPSTMPTTSSVQQPKMFLGLLKEYQLKGLQWLVNCYEQVHLYSKARHVSLSLARDLQCVEQGLNGILADEMGLGKTIQAMAFLGHLAEEKNIWGPFLVVAPASVLNNWADELNRFCPDFRILPYWGALNERVVLRKNINPNRLYRREAGFHVLITSYQLLVTDEKYFRRVKWQYMVLDEAQAIKSASSIRWKTLLSFNCRNRLLLTGTPIQNSMAELWALLHFIMPTLFDSHEQFNEWFSKGIEGHAEHGGTLNEHQLTRLHSILKPFMLRRVKKDVISEMTNKKEVVVPCSLSSRQQAFYQAIKNKISVADLFGNGGQLNDKKVLNLMNIVIQLRKVCNHPELFERNEGQSSVHFAALPHSLPPPPFGELEDIYFAGYSNPVSFKIPKILYRDGMHCLPTESSGSAQGFSEKWLRAHLNIFSAENIFASSMGLDKDENMVDGAACSGAFGFLRMIDLSAAEASFIAMGSMLERLLFALLWSEESSSVECYGDLSRAIVVDSHSHGNRISDDDPKSTLLNIENLEEGEDSRTRCVRRMLKVPIRTESKLLRTKHPAGPDWQPYEALVVSQQERLLGSISLLRSVRKYMPPVRAPQIDVLCSDRGLFLQRIEELQNPRVKQLLVGYARTSENNGPAIPLPLSSPIEESEIRARVLQPLFAVPFRIFGSAPPLQSFDFAKMLTDSGKLQTLDILLKRLRAGNHRVLLFAQMTKMLNILEDYMNYRKYKYLRLDGSSTIMDRRDMVKDFQHRPDIFVFLLSTRAGGLGINLTAADTVIFYESDWNPTMDLQAMDRAHRLGQTKEVTVYRLICKGTVEEKIVKRANQKNTVQQLVMTGNNASQGDVLEAEEVVSLLLDDAELEARMREQVSKQADKHGKRKKGWAVGGGLKGVRLDAEGGGASLDNEKIVPVDIVDNGGPPVGAGKELEASIDVGPGKKRRRSGEVKPARPPKMPKPAKEPKPPKPPKELKAPKQPRLPKQPRERKPPKEQWPPRDPRLPKQKGRQKKGAMALSESNTPSPSPIEDMNGESYGGSFTENGYSNDGGENHRANGDGTISSRPSTVSPDSLDGYV